VAISQVIVDLLVKAGVEAQRVRLIPSGIDPGGYQACAREPRSHGKQAVVGIVAALEKRKGHRFLLEAAALLKGQGHDLRYFLAGDGPLRLQLEEMAEKFNLKDEVRFFGFVADTAAFLSKVDIFVLPSLYEGLGVAALEAMAAGKPVIASRVGGLTELVIDAETGFLVPTQDGAALAKAIAVLAGDRAMAQRMGARGAERVRSHFTLERMAMKNEAYYYELLQGAAELR